jgi:hypothetical protein
MLGLYKFILTLYSNVTAIITRTIIMLRLVIIPIPSKNEQNYLSGYISVARLSAGQVEFVLNGL